MQISQDSNRGMFYIQSYHPGELRVNDRLIHHSIVLSHNELIEHWEPQNIVQLTKTHILTLFQYNPEIVLIGSGEQLNFMHPELLHLFYERKIGVEVMNTAAACRTYNVLISEGRRVVAVLFL